MMGNQNLKVYDQKVMDMKEIFNLLIDVFTRFSIFFRSLNDKFGLNLTDKLQHFFVIGFLCLFIFILVQFMFELLAKWKISSISFIYTLTLGLVIAFAIEIGQWKSGTGQMDFADVIYGFIILFVIYEMIKGLLLFVYKKITQAKAKKESFSL